jgi:hypothetical protein
VIVGLHLVVGVGTASNAADASEEDAQKSRQFCAQMIVPGGAWLFDKRARAAKTRRLEFWLRQLACATPDGTFPS